ncbi:MAG: hypothetical protein DRG59_13710, partial [Deltaproteobacteria bacterium]
MAAHAIRDDESVIFEEARGFNPVMAVKKAKELASPQMGLLKGDNVGAAASLTHKAYQIRKNLKRAKTIASKLRNARAFLVYMEKEGLLDASPVLFADSSIRAIIEKIEQTATPAELDAVYNHYKKMSLPLPQDVALDCAYILQQYDLKRKLKASEQLRKEPNLAVEKYLRASMPTSLKGFTELLNKLALIYFSPDYMDYRDAVRNKIFTIVGSSAYIDTLIQSYAKEIYGNALRPDILEEMKSRFILRLLEKFDSFDPSFSFQTFIGKIMRDVIHTMPQEMSGMPTKEKIRMAQIERWILEEKERRRQQVLRGQPLPEDQTLIPSDEEIIKQFNLTPQQWELIKERSGMIRVPLVSEVETEDEKAATADIVDLHPVMETEKEDPMEELDEYLKANADAIFKDDEHLKRIFIDLYQKPYLDEQAKKELIKAKYKLSDKEYNDVIFRMGLKIGNYIRYKDPSFFKKLNDKRLGEQLSHRSTKLYNGVTLPDFKSFADTLWKIYNRSDLPEKVTPKVKESFYRASRAIWLAEAHPEFKQIFDEAVDAMIHKPYAIRKEFSEYRIEYKSWLDKYMEKVKAKSPRERRLARENAEAMLSQLIDESRKSERYFSQKELNDMNIPVEIQNMYFAIQKQVQLFTKVFKKTLIERYGLNDARFVAAFEQAGELLDLPPEYLKTLSFEEVRVPLMRVAIQSGVAQEDIQPLLDDLQYWFETQQHLREVFEHFREGYFPFNRIFNEERPYGLLARLPAEERLAREEEYIAKAQAVSGKQPAFIPQYDYFATFETKSAREAEMKRLKAEGYEEITPIEYKNLLKSPEEFRKYSPYLSIIDLINLEQEFQRKKDLFDRHVSKGKFTP